MAGQERGFLQLYLEVPVVTRLYITASLIFTLLVNCEILSEYDIYLNPDLIFNRHQYWRCLTTFLYCGPFNFSTVFNLLFGYRYSRIIEENHYYRRSADFCLMYVFIGFIIVSVSMFFTNLLFLGQTLMHAILYVWCRRNPHARVLIFGLFALQADHVPYVLLGLSILTGSSVQTDLVAFFGGHCYYFLEDVFPMQRDGFKILKAPKILKFLFDELPSETDEPRERVDVIDENNIIPNVPLQ